MWLAAQEVHLHHHHHPPMSKGGRIQDMMMCQEASVSWVAQTPPSMHLSLIGVNLMKTCSTFIAKKETIAYKVEGREMEKRT